VSGARIAYTARPDATPKGERETLASIYAFVLRTHQKRPKATLSKRAEDAGSTPDGSGAAPVTRE
jgi:hypothetical protein